jgi:hypothetical protein
VLARTIPLPTASPTIVRASRTLPKTPSHNPTLVPRTPSGGRSVIRSDELYGRAPPQPVLGIGGKVRPPGGMRGGTVAPVGPVTSPKRGHFGLKTIHWIVFAGRPAVLAHGGASRLDSAPRGFTPYPRICPTLGIRLPYAWNTVGTRFAVVDSAGESALIPSDSRSKLVNADQYTALACAVRYVSAVWLCGLLRNEQQNKACLKICHIRSFSLLRVFVCGPRYRLTEDEQTQRCRRGLEEAAERRRRLIGCTVAGTPKDWVFAVILLS